MTPPSAVSPAYCQLPSAYLPSGGLFSVALSLKFGAECSPPPMGVTHGSVLWRPDFPRRTPPTGPKAGRSESAAAVRRPAVLHSNRKDVKTQRVETERMRGCKSTRVAQPAARGRRLGRASDKMQFKQIE